MTTDVLRDDFAVLSFHLATDHLSVNFFSFE